MKVQINFLLFRSSADAADGRAAHRGWPENFLDTRLREPYAGQDIRLPCRLLTCVNPSHWTFIVQKYARVTSSMENWYACVDPSMGRVIQACYVLSSCCVPSTSLSLPGPRTFLVFMIRPLFFRDFDVLEAAKQARFMFRHPNPECFAP
jgi:hypothetical protein